jgi:peptidoglycan/LPS O-acetylase OafA/YrhL
MPQLDGLRAIAVGLVLVQHYGRSNRWMDAIGPGGLGVALFFVLSGFLLTGILLDARPPPDAPLWPTLRVFYARRFVRILPLYYLVLAVTAALDVGPARRALGYNLAYLSNLYFACRGAWDGPISPLWSLSLEEQFYLAWPVAVLWLSRATISRSTAQGLARFTTFALALGLAGPLFRLVFLWSFGANPFALLLPFGYTDQLALGGALAALTRNPARGTAVRALDLAGLFVAGPLLFATMALPTPSAMSPAWVALWALRPTLVALLSLSLVLRASRSGRGPLASLLESRPLAHVGKVSYGVYLLHPYVHYAAYGLCAVPGLRWSRPLLDWLRADAWRWFPVGCATAVLAASVSYALFERPLSALKGRFAYPSPGREAR